MKKLFYFSFILAGLFIVSCAPDKKDDPTDPSTPATDARDKYVAYWNATEYSTSSPTTPTTFTVNIAKSQTSSTEITIFNFSGLSESARAVVNNNNLTIPYQQIGSIAFAQGTGTMTSSTHISLNYTMTIGASPTETYSATYVKQ